MKPFVLICGCPRSGTYLLATELGTQLDVAIPVESHFIPHFRRFQSLWRPLENPRRAAELLSAIAAFTRIWLAYGVRSNGAAALRAASVLAGFDSVEPRSSYPALVTAIFANYAKAKNAAYYGDKSAPFHPDDLFALDEVIEHLRVIHIVRDGRDVALSWCQEWFGPANIAEAAILWRRHIRNHRNWGHANPERYLEVRYEDFIRQPSALWPVVCGFLGLVPTTGYSTATHALRQSLLSEPTHRRLKRQPDPGNTGKWREAMSPVDCARFERLAGHELQLLGYETAISPLSRPTTMDRLRGGVNAVRRLFSPNHSLRQLRSVLPVILWLLQKATGRLDWVAPLDGDNTLASGPH